MELTELPVTIVIKAPNQRIDDHTVECMLGWTVKKLKNHLAEVYPSKPKEVHQRLIYSGKLLQDHLLLKDIIRQDNEQTHHTVHLVCSQQESQETVHVAPQSVSTASPTVTTMPNTDGLRYRGTTPNNFYSGTPNTNTSPVDQPQMMPPQTGMTQEQYMMMMQTYYNQMAAQYMQYYQTGVSPNMANIQITAPDTMLQNPQPIQPNNIPNRQDDNQNVILDARGRVVENVDNDDELGQHDWLDYVYTFSRFMVLISIVYFYSNFTRFAIVALFFFIVYLYQTGFFRVRRREAVRPQQPEPVQEQPQQHQQQENIQPEQQPQEENIETEETGPPEPPKPSVLSIAWSFFTTFFSSLIPQPPPALNGN